MSKVQAPEKIAEQAQAEQTQSVPTQKFSWRKKIRSTFVVAFALFAAINGVLTFTTPLKFDPYRYAYHGWSWWTMDSLRNALHESNVAVMGSSLMVSAVAGCDANYLNKPLDLTNYHGVSYLDDKLKENFGGKFRCFNLAAPGQMPSDAYLTLKSMAATSNRPDVVIYGVAPRDFFDSTLSGPCDTEPFRYLTRIVNIDDIVNGSFRSMWSKLDWYVQKTVFMDDHSLDFRLAIADGAQYVIDKFVPAPYSNHPFTWWDRTRVIPQYNPMEIHPGAVVSGPLTEKEITFTDNTTEYRQRYRKPDAHTFHMQLYFLRKLAEYCHRERIELVVVNMPITELNQSILPPGAYSNYLDALRKFAWNQNIVFYNLADFSKYKIKDFHDSVHLNAFGARKLFDNLIGSLSKDPRATVALSLTGEQLEKRTQLAETKIVRPAL
jgi:hypothetical protein